MVWSQEAGACADSVRYPPSWVTTKNDLLVRVENSQIAVRTVQVNRQSVVPPAPF